MLFEFLCNALRKWWVVLAWLLRKQEPRQVHESIWRTGYAAAYAELIVLHSFFDETCNIIVLLILIIGWTAQFLQK